MKPHEHEYDRPSGQGRSSLAVASVVAGIVLLALLSYLLVNRMSEMEHQLNLIRAEVGAALEKSSRAADHAEAALTKAMVAEQNAQLAALGRDRAELEAAEARQIAASAQDEAVQARQQAQLAEEEAARIRQEREEEMNRLQRALSQLVETRRTALGLVMNLDSHAIQFDFNKADLRWENRELLSRIAGILLTSKGYKVSIFGHTDDVGTEEYNLGLSQRRAETVRDYLVEAGIDPSIIDTRGFGKNQPLVRDTTNEARAKNRRVEIAIVDSFIEFHGVARN